MIVEILVKFKEDITVLFNKALSLAVYYVEFTQVPSSLQNGVADGQEQFPETAFLPFKHVAHALGPSVQVAH